VIILDITDAERAILHRVLKRIIDGMNTTDDEKNVARKVGRQVMGDQTAHVTLKPNG